MKILLALLLTCLCCHAAPVKLVEERAVAITEAQPGVWLVDFGRVAFGNLKLETPTGARGKLTIHFGEAMKDQRIDRKPPGTVRHAVAEVELKGPGAVIAAPPADARNTKQPEAVRTPPEWGVVLPFRWVEIEGWPGKPTVGEIVRQAAFARDWDDSAATFQCSDKTLTAIWELCRYSIKATTFAGVYVDGDRERIPYEADAYLNQLSHYYTSEDSQMARDTYDWLMKQPTWPTEWAPHMVFMARADWMRTGDAKWLATRYPALKGKLLQERVGPEGLVTSNQQQMTRDDIVDWPAGERDGYVFTKTNTVVNAFHLKALADMAVLAEALGKSGEAEDFKKRLKAGTARFNELLLDSGKCIYQDGVGTTHASLHANLFPLAFQLVPEDCRDRIASWLADRGMKCSVYAAQYLMEALFENGQARAALGLMTAPGDRSWRHMLESGTTITWEAWDQKYKPNQDWNHAWGAAPANLLPRYVLGAEPLTAGWKRARIRPCPGGLTSASGKIPTPRGPVFVEWAAGESFTMSVRVPPGMTAKLELPAAAESTGIWIGGKPAAATRVGDRWLLDDDVSGIARVEVR